MNSGAILDVHSIAGGLASSRCSVNSLSVVTGMLVEGLYFLPVWPVPFLSGSGCPSPSVLSTFQALCLPSPSSVIYASVHSRVTSPSSPCQELFVWHHLRVSGAVGNEQ